MQLGADQEREKQRLTAMEAQLPMLTHAQLGEYAARLAGDLNAMLNVLSTTHDEAERGVLLDEAKTLVETASLLSRRLDPNDKVAEHIREYSKRVERRRIPLRVLFGAASLINTLADATKGRAPDVVGAFEEARLEQVKISDDEWRELKAREFIATFKKQLSARAVSLDILPGVGGALKAREHVEALLGQGGCEASLLR